MYTPIPVVDLFAGCGGFGEGFNALKRGGRFPFDVRLHVEKENAPLATLMLRTFYHQFRESHLPDGYYEYIAGLTDRQDLLRSHAAASAEVNRRCLQVTLGHTPGTEELVVSKIRSAVGNTDKWVLIGGPPCQAYSTIGRSRNKANRAYIPEADHRMQLYKEYRNIIARLQPAVFVMENVRGLLSASVQGQPIFQSMIRDLSEPGYNLYNLSNGNLYGDAGAASAELRDFVIRTETYGIPQARHRVIVVGLRSDITSPPAPLTPTLPITSPAVLDGLPPVRSGLSSNDTPCNWLNAVCRITQQAWWHDIEPAIQHKIHETVQIMEIPDADRGGIFVPGRASCQYRPDWFLDSNLTGSLNHESRTHRIDDLWRYIFASCAVRENRRSFRISDFPHALLPNHRNVDNGRVDKFSDRFCVVPECTPSRTVVSHIRKDGHYFIHYDSAQCRSLTVREAARLQTFPDNYFFEGSRTDQYGQVGNAVPPLLSIQIADRVAEVLGK